MTRRRSNPTPGAPAAQLDVLVSAIADAVAARVAERVAAAVVPAPTVAPAEPQAEWLDTKAAAHYLDIAPKTLQEWRERGEGPKAHKVGKRAIRYARADLEAFARGGQS